MRNTLETRLGIFFALALVVAVLILELIGTFSFLQGGFRIYASFKNVQELRKGDEVRMAGVEIGRVENIALTNDLALITMKILDEYQKAIRTDCLAQIKATGLMGRNFISIEAGTTTSPEILPDGILQTTEPADLNALIEEAKKALHDVGGAAKSFNTENLSAMIGPIMDFVKQNTNNLTVAIANMRTVSDNIAAGKGTVGKLINSDEFYHNAYAAVTNLQTASADLKGLMTEANGMIADARQVVATINSGEGTMGHLVKDDTLFNQSTNVMANVLEILEKINRGYGTVGKLVNDDTLYRNAKLSLQKVEKATEGLEDQGPLSVLGIAINTLF